MGLNHFSKIDNLKTVDPASELVLADPTTKGKKLTPLKAPLDVPDNKVVPIVTVAPEPKMTRDQELRLRNPFQFSDDPHLDLVKLDTQIASQKLVPYSRSPFVQSLLNPVIKDELITV